MTLFLLPQAGIPVMAQSIVHRPMVPTGQHYEAEIEINDFPQHARWKVHLLLAPPCGN